MSHRSLVPVRLLVAAAVASCVGLHCQAQATTTVSDWSLSSDLAVVSPAPTDGVVQAQNPPSFTWARHPTTPASYTIELQRGTDAVITYTTNRNWYLPSKKLAAGSYRWHVRPTNLPTAWSPYRTFTIDATSVVFEVPENDALSATVLAHPRPRSLPPVFPLYKDWTPAMIAERGATYKRLVDDVVGHMPVKSLSDADWPLLTTVASVAENAQNGDIRNRVDVVSHQAQAAALLYRLTGTVSYLNEALARGDQMAALSPVGPTSYVYQDQADREIALSLAKTIDLLPSATDLSAARRAAWLKVVNVRTDAIYQDLASSNGRLDQYPYDSHGANALEYLAEIAALTLGDLPAAQTWFNFSVRDFFSSTSVWSGSEGGFSNGTGYGLVEIAYYMESFTSLAQSTGVNMFTKPWATGFLNFFAEFTPPGAKTHVFGDGHESAPDTNFLKAFASRLPTPAAKWYYNNLTGTEDGVTLLVSPSPLPVNATPTAMPPPNFLVLPGIGWVAMHSNLGDMTNRTSLYFKSSPYGGYNHSHADQNGILLNSANVPLLIEAGYYDYYSSPLWFSWYHATKSHNSITYDNGIGIDTSGNTINMSRRGAITAFQPATASSNYDYTEGDASVAYDGMLSTALRKIWYPRNGQNVYVVLDTLASPVAHSFEWNMHALVPLATNADGSIRIVNGTQSVCIRSLTPTAKFTPLTYPAYVRPGVAEYHGAFKLPSAKKAEFLTLLDVGCKNPAVSLVTNSSSRLLNVGGQVMTLPLP